jgi:hypothetical protein
MLYKKIFFQMRCIASFNLANKPMPIFFLNPALFGNPCNTFTLKLSKIKRTREKTNKVFTYTLKTCKEVHLRGTYFDGDNDSCLC